MNSNIITADRYLTIRCRAFTGQGVRSQRIHVSPDVVEGVEVTRGTIRVWDEVAGHFTTCHALSMATMRKIRRMFQP